MKKFAVFDIDGTLIRWQLYHAMADELARRGHIDENVYQRMRDARMAWKKRSEASFREYEIEAIGVYEAALKNLAFAELDEAIEKVFNEYRDQVYVYTRDLLKRLKKSGYVLLAISGSQAEIVKKIAEHYNFDDFEATVYERSANSFTGNKMVAAHHKDQALNKLIKKHGLSSNGSVAVGDSFSDVAMLELVETPIAFNPEEKLFEHASNRGWKIVVERKNVVYDLEKDDGRYQLVEAGN